MKVAYIRVSTVEQNEARQLEAMKNKGMEKYFTEKVSGKDTNRPQLKAMLDFVREGDTVYIHDFSRLARSTKDLLDIVEQLHNKGVYLVSNKENIDTSICWKDKEKALRLPGVRVNSKAVRLRP